MKQRFKQTIQVKLLGIIISIVVTVLALAFVFITISDYQLYRREFYQATETLTDILTLNISSAVIFEDTKQTGLILNNFSRIHSIDRIIIWKPDKTVFYQYVRSEKVSPQPSPILTATQYYDGDKLIFNRPIVVDGKTYGYLYLESNTSFLKNILLDRLYFFSGLFILLVIIAYGLARVLQRSITTPIFNALHHLHTISAQKDFSRRLPETRNDEFGQLFHGINNLLNTIQAHAEELNYTLNELRRSEKRFRYIFEKSNDAMYIWQDNKFVLINPRFQELFGYTQEETTAPDFNFMTLVAPESRPLIEERQKKRARGETVSNQVTFKALTRDGKTLIIASSLSEIQWNERPAVLGILRDITHQVNLEEQLRQAQKMEAIGKLAGGIAHDFNNILTAIMGHAQLAMLCLDDPSMLSKELEEILKGADRAANLTRQLLGFSRKQIVQLENVDMNKIIANLEKMLRRLIREEISLEFQFYEEPLLVRADTTQIEQILINLVINAQDAILEKKNTSNGKITVRLEKTLVSELPYYDETAPFTPGWFVCLSVRDNGIGISSEIKNRIFEPFFTTKPKEKGTGLGLAQVYGIVRQNNGHIHVYSEPGYGTIFKIYWPLLQTQELETIKKQAKNQIRLKGSETILFIEDDSGIRNFATRILEEYGYTVLEATDGKHGFTLFKENKEKIDVVVTDTVMPNMSGRDLAEAIWKIAPQIPILFTSGYTDEDIVTDSVLNEGIDFISKPYHVEELVRKIRYLLDQPPQSPTDN